ncbi:hypothetical protein ACGFZB_38255 [Streptomyces cinerochromogenes]|uniref:Uncharacterized protein n=1 Tax=Streptomyces cinerochromogenes TaxID=66422 RepID=A0ABW7BK96_9ACTN
MKPASPTELLAALEKPPLLPGRFPGGRQPAWEAATAWITALPVTRLTVLRAHRLTARRAMRLLELPVLTGIHLTLVCHRPHLPAALHQALRTDHPGTRITLVLCGAGSERALARLPQLASRIGAWQEVPHLATAEAAAAMAGFHPPGARPNNFMTGTLLLGGQGDGPDGRNPRTAAIRDSPADLNRDGGSRNCKQSQSDRWGDRQGDGRAAHGAGRREAEGHPPQGPAADRLGTNWRRPWGVHGVD